MELIKGFEESGNLIVVTGMIGSGSSVISRKIAASTGFHLLDFDAFLIDWLNVSKFDSKEDRLEFKKLAAEIFFLDWILASEDNNSFIISGEFSKAWNGLIGCFAREHKYSITVVNCNTLPFATVYSNNLKLLSTEHSLPLRCTSFDGVSYELDSMFDTCEYRDRCSAMYRDCKFNKIEGDVVYSLHDLQQVF